MPILELFPKPARGNDPSSDHAADPGANGTAPPPKAGAKPQLAPTGHSRRLHPLRRDHRISIATGRFGELDEHELIHLIDALDDERARARFRESVYISIIVWLAIGWFLFYGPRVLFHLPQYRDPIAVMKEHDQQITLNMPRARPIPRVAPKIDNKTLEALKRAAELERLAHPTPPTPQPPVQPQPQAQPQQEARNAAPPVPQPAMPLPAAPKPAAPSVELPSAPAPNIARNEPPRDAFQNPMRGMPSPRGGGQFGAPGSAGPLKAGAEILSDTQGVDFSDYMRRLEADLYRNWEPLIPEEVQAPLLKKGIVGIRFTILPNGELSQPMVLETTSGDVALDKAAWYAITSEGQFPPLPKAFHGPNLQLRVGFYYNEPIQQ